MPDDISIDDDLLKAWKSAPKAASKSSYDDLVERHARDNQVDPNLIRAVMSQESGGRPNAVSPKNARGLMQLIPATAARFGTRNIHDPNENIRGGARYLRFLNDRFKGNTDLVLAAYNAGEGAVEKYGNKIPPYRETQNYVPSVKARYQKLTGQQPQQQRQAQTPPEIDPELLSAWTGETQTVPPVEQPRSTPLAQPQGRTTVMSAPVRRRQPQQPAQRPASTRSGLFDIPRPPLSIADVRRADNEAIQAADRTVRQQVRRERMSDAPAPTRLIAKGLRMFGPQGVPLLTAAKELTTTEDAMVDEEVANRLAQQRLAATPEVEAGRREFGQQSAPVRALTMPAGRAGANLVKTLAGLSSFGGIAPNEASDYLSKRAAVLEQAASLAPLDAAGQEIERGIAEKGGGAVLDVGFTVAQLIAMKKATGLSLSKIMMLETALRTSDQPVKERAAQVAQAGVMGRALDVQMGRGAGAAVNVVPTLAQEVPAVAAGQRDPIDAAINTAVQAGTGALLTSPRRQTPLQPMPDVAVREAAPTLRPSELQRRVALRGEVTDAPVSVRDNAGQRIQPTSGVGVRVEGQRPVGENVVSEQQSNQARVPATVEEASPQNLTAVEARVEDRPSDVPAEPAKPQWQHRDFGFITQADDQRSVGRGRVRVTAEDGSEHVIQRSNLRGEGNNLAVPVKAEHLPSIAGEGKAPAGPATESQVSAAQSASGPETHPTVRRVLSSEYKDKILKAIGSDAAAYNPTELGGIRASSVEFRKPDRTRVIIEDAAFSDLPPTYGSKRDGFVVRTIRSESAPQPPEPAAPTTRAAESAQPLKPETLPAGRTRLGDRTDYDRLYPPGSQKRADYEAATKKAMDEIAAGKKPSVTELPPSSTAAAKAPPPKLPETTSVKNAATNELRRDLDLLELEGPERKSWRATIDNALAKGLDKKAEEIAERVIKSDRKEGLSDEEAAGVQHRLRELENEFEDRYRANSADPALRDLKTRVANLTRATNEGGTAPARALNFRRSAVDKEFRLINVITRMEAVKGRELQPKELSRYEDMVKQRDAAIQQRDAALEKARTQQIQKQIDRAARQRTRAETREALDAEAAAIKQQIAAEFARLKSAQNIQASGLAGLDPEGVITKNLLRYARNRVKANVGIKAEQLIDDVHSLVGDYMDRRQVAELISGYKLQVPERQPEDVRRLGEIRSEIKRLLTAEDVAKGVVTERAQGPSRRFVSRNEQRLKQLEKQEADMVRRMTEGDYSKPPKAEPLPYTREVAAKQRQVEEIERQFKREEYRATRSTGGKITDELAKAAGVGKTIKSMGDISAVFRQGGFYAITHPVKGLALPFRDMVKSFSDAGYRTVESAIKSHPKFEQARKDGVEFTGVDKDDPNLSKHEEGYLGREYLDYIPIAKQISRFSERTFVSFLDSQRMQMYDVMTDGLTSPSRISRLLGARRGLDPAALKAEQQRIAKAINSATGRGNLTAKGNQIAPVLNIAMFSPRLLKSRVELLSNMLNPVAIARMPRNARAQIIQDNVRFLAATVGVMTLSKSLGADVNLDPDSSDFLKIRFGSTTYDTLVGLQQPFRYLLNMSRAMSPIDSRTLQAGDYYAGQSPWAMTAGTKTRGGFLESKASPAASAVIESVRGSDFLGRKRTKTARAIDFVTPLPAKDVMEAFKEEGLIGSIKSLPALTGISVNTYPPPTEPAKTLAEKMARKLIRDRMPDVARTEDEMETSRKASDLRARSRRGEDVSAELPPLNLTERQTKTITDAKGVPRFQEDVKRLGVEDILRVWRVASADERAVIKPLLADKADNAMRNYDPAKKAEVTAQLRAIGIVPVEELSPERQDQIRREKRLKSREESLERRQKPRQRPSLGYGIQ